jgi:hypothetical protein
MKPLTFLPSLAPLIVFMMVMVFSYFNLLHTSIYLSIQLSAGCLCSVMQLQRGVEWWWILNEGFPEKHILSCVGSPKFL